MKWRLGIEYRRRDSDQTEAAQDGQTVMEAA